MKLLTRDTDYAIRALCYIAKAENSIVSVDELVLALKIPKPFLRKILQILNKEKLLESFKGSKGGFRLVWSTKQITVLKVLEIFQGKLQLNECTLRKQICSDTKVCLLRKKLNTIQDQVRRELKNMSLASLIKNRG
ncbi:MAG: Rrf2 family transcriptional regulator [Candidatus Omnitrophica bacterium]|nr:Rrf2 family transcriptional regulator [Candidatus Omnitrophota bacterium]